MKLLIVTQRVDKNDAVLGFFHRWVEEFAKHASEVFVIAGFAGEHSLPSNVRIFSLGKEKGFNKFRRIWRYWELFSKYYAKSEAVFFHMCPEFVLAASPFLFSLKKPSGLWYVHKRAGLRLKAAERMVGYVFTASELSFRLPSKKVIYTGHAIDTELFHPGSSQSPASIRPGYGAPRLLAVGRISPVKDLETLVRACAILKETWDREWTLSIVGGALLPRDSVYLENIKKIISEKKLGNRIIFLGARPYQEMPSIYSDHDILISTTETGSFDKAALEAMSSGLSVIVSSLAFKNIIPDKYLLEQKSPELLAERIKALADEPRPNFALREIVVKNHSLQNTIAAIAEYLRSGMRNSGLRVDPNKDALSKSEQ